MNFFEGSARVPLIVHSPKRFKPKRIGQPRSRCSTSCRPSATSPATPRPRASTRCPGRSLLDLCERRAGPTQEPREVIGEYMGEGSIAPIVMIRRGDLKYVHSPVDPDQLYDLAADPARAGQPRRGPRLVGHASRSCARGSSALGLRRPHRRRGRRPGAAAGWSTTRCAPAGHARGSTPRRTTVASSTCATTSTSTTWSPALAPGQPGCPRGPRGRGGAGVRALRRARGIARRCPVVESSTTSRGMHMEFGIFTVGDVTTDPTTGARRASTSGSRTPSPSRRRPRRSGSTSSPSASTTTRRSSRRPRRRCWPTSLRRPSGSCCRRPPR